MAYSSLHSPLFSVWCLTEPEAIAAFELRWASVPNLADEEPDITILLARFDAAKLDTYEIAPIVGHNRPGVLLDDPRYMYRAAAYGFIASGASAGATADSDDPVPPPLPPPPPSPPSIYLTSPWLAAERAALASLEALVMEEGPPGDYTPIVHAAVYDRAMLGARGDIDELASGPPGSITISEWRERVPNRGRGKAKYRWKVHRVKVMWRASTIIQPSDIPAPLDNDYDSPL